MPKRLSQPPQRKPVLRRERLTQEAASLRRRAKQAHDSETRVEFEEMAERRELLVVAIEALESAPGEPADEASSEETPIAFPATAHETKD